MKANRNQSFFPQWILCFAMLAASGLLIAQNPPLNLTYEKGLDFVQLKWDEPMPEGLAELHYHDNTPHSAYYQTFNLGYGTIFELSAWASPVLQYLDFRHSPWGVSGLFEYRLHIYDPENPSQPIAIIEDLETTLTDGWESGIPLGGLEVPTRVCIVMEPLGNTSENAYPVIDFDEQLNASSRIVNIQDTYSLSSIAEGDFLMNLWITSGEYRGGSCLTKVSPYQSHSAQDIPRPALRGRQADPCDFRPLTRMITGYRVYKDNELMSELPGTALTCYDETPIPGITHEYKISAMYDETVESGYSNSVYCITGLDEYRLLQEGFENGFPPSSWTIVDQDGNGVNWQLSDDSQTPHSGAFCVSSPCDNSNVNYLISPPIDIDRISWLKFWVNTDNSYPADYQIKISTGGIEPEDFTSTLLDTTATNRTWEFVRKSLRSYVGQTIRFALVTQSTTHAQTLMIDDVFVDTVFRPDDGYPAGTGTEEDPFLIYNFETFIWISRHSTQWNAHYKQLVDIDAHLTSSSVYSLNQFLPIGTNEYIPFTGSYNGQGFTISNLHCSYPNDDYVGLFGYISGAQISNIVLSECDIDGTNYVGGIAGKAVDGSSISECSVEGEINGDTYTGGVVGYLEGMDITDCDVSYLTVRGGDYSGGIAGALENGNMHNCHRELCNVYGGECVGGLIGKHLNGSITDCTSDGSIAFSELYVGGIVGYADSCTISNCTNESQLNHGPEEAGGICGHFSGTASMLVNNGRVYGSDQAGGLFGYFESGTIVQSYNTGEIPGSTSVGGLVGYMESGTIEQSYSTDAVSGSGNTGGLIGQLVSGEISQCFSSGTVTGVDRAGGLVGGCDGGVVSDSYSYAVVEGESNTGGLIGTQGEASIVNCFWDTTTSQQAESDGGTGLTWTQMMYPAPYIDAGWDFLEETENGTVDIWGIDPASNGGYPYFAWRGAEYKPPLQPQGAGTESDPYRVESTCELYWLELNDSAWDSSIELIADVNASATSRWFSNRGFMTFGTFQTPFTGTFDGQGHAIDSLFIDNEDASPKGLFGYIQNATIRNLAMTNVSITAQQYAGAIAGYAIDDCTIENCSSSGTIVCDLFAGGICGATYYGNTIQQSYSNADVEGSRFIGGLIGYSVLSGIENSYAMGNVSGDDCIGGFVGKLAEHVDVTHCYSCGIVTGETQTGGFAGCRENSQVEDCFWDIETSGQDESYGGTGLSTIEMHVQDTYIQAGWDFMEESFNGDEDIWGINPSENSGYPFLAWEGYVDTDDTLVPDVSRTVLHANYPNPFNPTTTISFSVKQGESAKLEIYNVKGQRVKTYPEFKAGSHQVVWRGNNDTGKPVASGVYLYRLTDRKTSQIRKMLLLQ